ncbi:hypothetical protein ANO14919_104400 [Xylariales sp. No.14919]|nr:hypothetical protein ANO14919_104400 [Xylariales sp. No.14919]
MFNVGTVYAPSSLQNGVPRLFKVSQPWPYSLFVAAFLGLSIGVSICASCITAYGEYFIAVAGTALWGISVASAGYFLATIPSMVGVLGSLFICGIGVGLTYLATIVLVGRAFPNQPLARSSIGPLGLSSGAMSWFAAWSHFQVTTREAEQLGNVLEIASAFIIRTAVVSFYLAPGRNARSLASIAVPSLNSEKAASRRFCNVLGGMAAFGALCPIAFLYVRKTTGPALEILPYLMAALALRGFFVFSHKQSTWTKIHVYHALLHTRLIAYHYLIVPNTV